jgi:hypothetical protein
MFATNYRSLVINSGLSLKQQTRMNLLRTNTLAYFSLRISGKEKSFITFKQGINVIKLLCITDAAA